VQRRRGAFADAVTNYKLSSELDPKAYQPLFSGAEALLYLRRYNEASQLVDRTLALSPNFFDGYLLRATLRIHQTRSPAEARRLIADLATREAPADWRWENHHWRAGLFRIIDEDATSALAHAQEGRYGLEPGNFLVARGMTLQRFGRADSARFYFDSAAKFMRAKIERDPETPEYHALLGLALAGLKNAPEGTAEALRAESMLNEKMDGLDGPEWVINVAQTYALLGDKDKTIEWLTRAMRSPSRLSPAWIALDPLWEFVRTDERFQRLVKNPPAFATVVATR
jgi:tetratricopeptide (TPR) repeat protein